ncbi:MAG: hypothetical protein ACM3O3_03305 [Syntrophothermus sp.]
MKIRFIFFYFILLTAVILPQNTSELSPSTEAEHFLEGAKVYDIKQTDDLILVATYGDGVFAYDKAEGKWTSYSTKNNTIENDFFYCIASSKDYIWAGSSEGLFTYDKKKDQWTKRSFALGGQFGNWIRALKYDPNENTLWIGRFRNITRLDVAKKKFTDYDRTQKNDAKSNTILSIELDGDSLIWFGTESGVHKLNKRMNPDNADAWTYLNNRDGGFLDEGDAVAVGDMMQEGNYIWFGTEEFVTPEKPKFNVGGVYRFDHKSAWDRISKQNGLTSNGVYSLERTGNYVWASLYWFDRNDKQEYGKGLVLINRFNGVVKPLDLNLTNINTSNIFSLYFDGKDMWIGTDNGLWRLPVVNPLAKWTATKEEKQKDQTKAPIKKKPTKKKKK